MARPNWEYIRVDVLLPDSPKLDGLSSAAKWALIEMWLHCGQHLTDGFVRDKKWKQIGTPAQRAAIVAAGSAERVPGGYQMHDYLEHQRSRADVEKLRAKRAKAGRKGGRAKAKAVALAKQELEHLPKQTPSKSVAEAEAEAEADRSVADVVGRSNGSRPAREDLIDLIITELRTATGRTVGRDWAARTRAYILDGRSTADPAAYIRAAIRNEPDPRTRFLPLYEDQP